MNKEQNKIPDNLTELESAERISCDNCSELVIFELKDSQNREFTIGLTTVLECLAFAILQGELPQLPRSWCSDVERALNIELSEEVSYYDYETFRRRWK